MLSPAVVLAIVVAVALMPALAFALAPDPPTNLQVTPGAASPAIAQLTWSPPASGSVARYEVFVSAFESSGYGPAGVTDSTEFTFSAGLGGVPYYFRVVAVSPEGDGSSPAQAGPVTASWSDSPHEPMTKSSQMCGKCHGVHMTENDLLFRSEVTSGTLATTGNCYVCHDGRNASAANIASGTVDSFALTSGHSIEASGAGDLTVTCSSCHASHGATSDLQMLPIQSVSQTGPEWCYECHDAANKWYAGTYPDAAAPQRDASGYPEVGTWLGETVYAGSTSGHRLLPETTQTAPGGGDVRRKAGDCLYCHASHRGQGTHDSLRAAYRPSTASTVASDQANGTYASACFMCHGGVRPSGFATTPVDIKQFVTSGQPRAGHRIETSGGVLPVGSPLPCYECHNPHGSSRGNASLISDTLGQSLGTSTPAGVRRFCLSCHTTSDTGAGWDSESATYTVVAGSETVVGIPRTGGVLSLPSAAGHRTSDATSCNMCHGENYGAGGTNVHNPGAERVRLTSRRQT